MIHVQAVILAGGKGTRIGKKDSPKVMIKIGNKPVLQHQIELLSRHGIRDVIMCVKHMSGIIKEHFGDGSRFGVNISYSEEEDFLGTAGAVKFAEKMIRDDFVLLYGDVMVNLNISKLIEYHRKKKASATLVAHESDHPGDSDVVDMDAEHRVKRIWRPSGNEDFRNLTNAALYVMKKEVLEHVERGRTSDFGKDLLPKLLEKGVPVYGYITEEYLKDMGTPERLAKVRSDYEKGRIFRPAVFLDRDGVINEQIYPGIHKPSQIKLIEGSAEGVKLLNENGFSVVVITNQPVVARNLCTEDELVKIHERMKSLLAERGASIDGIYYCPHHPDSGYPEENPEYKVECGCRKPKPGLIFKAMKEFSLGPGKCVMVGDRITDVEAGKAAGCVTVLVKTGTGSQERNIKSEADHVCENLLDAAELIIKTYKPR